MSSNGGPMDASATLDRISKAAPQMTELGSAGLQTSGGRVEEEFLWQLRGTLGPRVFREMAENDAVVGAVLYAVEHMIRGVSWTVEPGGDAPEDLRATELLESVPEDMSHTWADFTSEWMACPVYGYAPFEIIWKRRQGEKRTPGEASRFDDGLIGVRKLAIRHPDTLLRWEIDPEGGVQAMVQSAPPKYTAVTIPIEKLLLFRMMVRKGSPEGRSLLRSAYSSWFRKKRIEGFESIGIERDLAGLPVMYVPAEWMTSSTYSAMLAEAKSIVRNIRNDEQSGLVLPMIISEGNQQMLKFELMATGGTRKIDTNPVLERLSRQIAMTVLADVILLGHEKVGSYALASSKTNLFSAGLGAMLDDTEAVLNRHLVPRLLRLNGMQVEKPPQFRHGDVESIELSEVAAFITSLAQAGFPLFPTASGELERHLMRLANLPDDVVEGRVMVSGADMDPDAPALGVAGQPAAVPDASEGVGGVATDESARLNGAQITAAVEVLRAAVAGELAEYPAIELLVGIGIPRDRAQQMVKTQVSQAELRVPVAAA